MVDIVASAPRSNNAVEYGASLGAITEALVRCSEQLYLRGKPGYFRNSQRMNVSRRLTRMQVMSGKWNMKFPRE